VAPGVGEGVFTSWAKLWEKTDGDLAKFAGAGSVYTSGSAIYLDEADGFFVYANSSGTPSVVQQSLADGSYLSSTKNLLLITSAFDAAHTIRARYVAMQGDNVSGGGSTVMKFAVLQKGKVVFQSASIIKAGDTSVAGIEILTISNSGRLIAIQYFDATDGLRHIQVWQGS
jgi:hypothetical protein